MKTITIGDTVYDLTRAYKAGAKANRDGISFRSNPYEDGSQDYYDWNSGHENEDEEPEMRPKTLSWKPVRKGATYCASACGRGCTHAEYLDAVAKADSLVKRLPKGWKPVVTENLGWHFRVEKDGSAIHYFGARKYWASLVFAGHQFHEMGGTPKAALKAALDAAKAFAFLLTDEIEEFEK